MIVARANENWELKTENRETKDLRGRSFRFWMSFGNWLAVKVFAVDGDDGVAGNESRLLLFFVVNTDAREVQGLANPLKTAASRAYASLFSMTNRIPERHISFRCRAMRIGSCWKKRHRCCDG